MTYKVMSLCKLIKSKEGYYYTAERKYGKRETALPSENYAFLLFYMALLWLRFHIVCSIRVFSKIGVLRFPVL